MRRVYSRQDWERRRFLTVAGATVAGLFLPSEVRSQTSAPSPAPVVASAKRPKRIVLCADGTWNEPERIDPQTGRPLPTNVLKVARGVRPLAKDGTPQVIFYHAGVGTAGGLDEITGGAFGEGIEKNVRDLYRFLVLNYEPGDQVFFFGFSRGAFTVRTLAGFLRKALLIQKNDEYYTPELFKLYATRSATDSPEWQAITNHFRNKPVAPEIHFLGVWDTVGALGAPGFLGQVFNSHKYEYHDIDLNPTIRNAFHALAIDERRKPFAPSIWTRPADWRGALEQVWFAGVHSNVGGSYHPDGLANEALHWMIGKAETLGLEFDDSYLVHYIPCFNSNLNDSMSAMYKFMGPNIRRIGDHLSDGEAIHQSVLDRMKLDACRYNPENLRRFLDANSTPVIATTTRASRGVACPDSTATEQSTRVTCPSE